MTRIYFCCLLFLTPFTSLAQTLGDDRAVVYALDILPERQLVAAIVDKTEVQLWNYNTQILVKSWQLAAPANALAFGNDFLAIALENGSIELLNTLDSGTSKSIRLGANPVVGVKFIGGAQFIAADSEGTIYVSDTTGNDLSFRRLVTCEHPLTALDGSAGENLIVASGPDNTIYAWSLTEGELINKYPTGGHPILALKCEGENGGIIVAFASGRIKKFRVRSDANLYTLFERKVSHWPMGLDAAGNVVAVGTTGGHVRAYAGAVTYKYKLNAMINAIRIDPAQLPRIVLLAGTHGGGIQLLNASDMKYSY